MVTTSSSGSLRSYLLSPLFFYEYLLLNSAQYYRKCKRHTYRGTIQFDIETMRIRYRVNGVYMFVKLVTGVTKCRLGSDKIVPSVL